MRSILCRLGSHDWKYNSEKLIPFRTYRTCERCGLTQKYTEEGNDSYWSYVP